MDNLSKATWAIGVTATPSRVNDLLPATLRSIARAGFDPPIIFMDGAADIGELEGYSGLVIRHPHGGHLVNWMGALHELYSIHPRASKFLIFEDDLLCCSNLREYLDRVLLDPKGYYNLLTHDENLVRVGGKRGWHASNQRGRGAVGLLLNRDAVLSILKAEDTYKRIAQPTNRCADGVLCEVLKPLGFTEYIHYPSLIQHVGLTSSLGHHYGTVHGFMGEDYDPRELLEPITEKESKMYEQEALGKMVAPGQPRPGIWRSGIIQVHVTRACDLACFGCTQGSNLAGKPVMITPEDFRLAVQSLEGYWGVVGIFGGNPAVHPQFETLCEILAEYFPIQQRGLWCNHPKGKGAIMRRFFNPHVSNLNVHGKQEAFDEFKRDWPESKPFGVDTDSRHSPPFVAMQDVIHDEARRWELISNCDINQRWSAMVCSIPGKGIRGFFCELAGAQAMLHANDPTWPDTGVQATPGWWRMPMSEFAEQVRWHCHRCGIPLRRAGQLSQLGEYEEVSVVHQDIYKPKEKGREVRLVQIDSGAHLARVTDYVENGRAKIPAAE